MDTMAELVGEEGCESVSLTYLHGLEDGIILARKEIAGLSGVNGMSDKDADDLDKTFKYMLEKVQSRKALMVWAYVDSAP